VEEFETNYNKLDVPRGKKEAVVRKESDHEDTIFYASAAEERAEARVRGIDPRAGTRANVNAFCITNCSVHVERKCFGAATLQWL
jgi:hypothetical protein